MPPSTRPWREALEPQGDSVAVRVLVQPRASRTRLVGVHDRRIKVALSAPPVEGAANKALIRWFSAALNVARGEVRVATGHSGRRKRVVIAGVSLSHVERRLEALLPEQARDPGQP